MSLCRAQRYAIVFNYYSKAQRVMNLFPLHSVVTLCCDCSMTLCYITIDTGTAMQRSLHAHDKFGCLTSCFFGTIIQGRKYETGKCAFTSLAFPTLNYKCSSMRKESILYCVNLLSLSLFSMCISLTLVSLPSINIYW